MEIQYIVSSLATKHNKVKTSQKLPKDLQT